MRRADYQQALEAARRWIAELGRYPQQQEWEYRVLKCWAWASFRIRVAMPNDGPEPVSQEPEPPRQQPQFKPGDPVIYDRRGTIETIQGPWARVRVEGLDGEGNRTIDHVLLDNLEPAPEPEPEGEPRQESEAGPRLR